MSRFWQQRIIEASLLSTAVMLFLYGWNKMSNNPRLEALHLSISDAGAIASGATLIFGIIAYILIPKTRHAFLGASSYLLTAAATMVIVVTNTGHLHSSFFGIWVVLALLSAPFSRTGYIGTFLIAAAGTAYVYFLRDSTINEVGIFILLSMLPIVISFSLWDKHRKAIAYGKENMAFSKLATEYSSVSNKSDVIIQAIADGVITLDRKGNIDVINPAAETILGWSKNDAKKLNYRSILKLKNLNNKEVEEQVDPIAHALSTNQPQSEDKLQIETHSGKLFLASITVSPISHSNDGVIVVFRDITKEKAEEREQAEFISTASHEMRTPVASIEGYLGLALNPSTAVIDDKAREFIGKAHESAQHLGRLFQDLLDITKAEDGRLANNPKVVDLVPFTHEIAKTLLPRASQKEIRINYKPMPDLYQEEDQSGRVMTPVYYANVDNDHLREVLSNLIENAVKYTLKGEVTIDITGDNSKATVSIQDTGIGIPSEDLPHLFQKFYRVDNTDTREIGGTGLGLYLSRKLVETMGGRIWVESVYKKGSTFFVELPRVDNLEAQRIIEMAAETNAPQIKDVTSQPAPDNSSTAPQPPAAPQQTPSQAPQTPPPTAPAPTPAQQATAAPVTLEAPAAANAAPSAFLPEPPQQDTQSTPSTQQASSMAAQPNPIQPMQHSRTISPQTGHAPPTIQPVSQATPIATQSLKKQPQQQRNAAPPVQPRLTIDYSKKNQKTS